MNYSKSIFLINQNARSILVSYDGADLREKKMMFKTLDASIKKDDLVVVPTTTRYNMTVCKVVDTDVDVDYDSPEEILWVVQKIDQESYKAILAQEQVAIQIIRTSETKRKRADLAKVFLANNEELASLPLADIKPVETAKPPQS